MSARPESTSPANLIPAIGDVVSGKYRVEGTAGIGGMGVVLAATHIELGHRVAIKMLMSECATDNTAIERFLREGKVAASLQSDHVVRIYDVGRLESGMPFMVMELLRGQDLGSLIGAAGAIETAQAVDWILQACSAIAEAHANGIIHRDLKPANLFLTQRSDGSDCVKVLDFGISKQITSEQAQVLQGSLTATRQVIGSPAYMSPEQVRNSREIDHRVDIWALGMTLYEFLAGRPAFDADTFPAVCAAIVADVPPPLHEVATGIPRGLENIVLKCLDKEPSRRFTSVNELASALQPFGSSRPASAAHSYQKQSSADATQTTANQPATLASVRPPDIQASAARPHVTLNKELMARTLQSSSHDEPASLSNPRHRLLQAASRHHIWLFLGALGFIGGAIWTFRTATSTDFQPARQRAVATPPRHDSFSIRFESEPSGAGVWEGERMLGTTPLAYSVERASLVQHARVFVVRSDGYAPFAITQGDTEQDVSVVAHLHPMALVAPTATVNNHDTQGSPPSLPLSGKAAAKTRPAVAGGAAPVPDDIRTQR